MKALTVHDVFKIARFTDTLCINSCDVMADSTEDGLLSTGNVKVVPTT
jgi:hypothetical protein